MVCTAEAAKCVVRLGRSYPHEDPSCSGPVPTAKTTLNPAHVRPERRALQNEPRLDDGAYLGPAVRVRRGETVVARVSNSVPENITMHWHGLIVPGAADGGPHQVIPPGKCWQTELLVDQPAATLWFHPHLYPSTADLVIKGLAGLMIIDDDDESARLRLPAQWGVDDIPLIIQDRRFTADG